METALGGSRTALETRSLERELKTALASLCAEICACGLTGVLSSGNASVRDARERVIAITPRAVAFADVAPEDGVIVELDADLRPIATPSPSASTELPLHLAVYRRAPQAPTAVVHLHSPYAVTASCLALDRLPFVH